MKLLRNLALSLTLLATLTVAASAQIISTDKGKASDEIIMKIHKVELLNQILPLFLTKTQINDKILPAIEKARGKWRDLLAQEDDVLSKIGPQVDETITNAIDKSQYPSRDLLLDIQAKTKSMSLKRTVLTIQLVDDITGVLKDTLDKGQMKALIGSFDARFIDPKTKPEEMSEDTKRSFFVQNVFMDPACREILIDIAKKLPDAK